MPSPDPSSLPAADCLWLNHQVLLTRAGAPAPAAASWRATWRPAGGEPSAEAGLFGFATPAAAAGPHAAFASREARGFSVPAVPAPHRAAFLTFLHTALAWELPSAEIQLLAEQLRIIRDAWQPPTPGPQFAGAPLACVDVLARAGDGAVYVKGWWRSCHGEPVRLTAVSPEGLRQELLTAAFRFPRADIPAAFPGDTYTGFTAFFELEKRTVLREGWWVEIETTDGFKAGVPAPRILIEPGEIFAAILPDVQLQAPPRPGGPAERVHALVSPLQTRSLGALAVREEVPLGPPVPAPILSVIVPLYGRIDLVEHQLAQFAADPAWARCDLIYVLDSPADWERLAWRTEALARLYGLSLRLLRLNAHGGYAAANNLAVTRARAGMLLFLNSDVLPAAPGWIEPMLAAYRSRPRTGALGPKLLFEDNSIQHAGESFQPAGDGFAWDALPYFKGLHRDLPAANQARQVPAVTGACLLVSRERFERAGGFDQGYVQGDFEDMDLCLRLLRAGCENWYEPAIELYHLEGLSYPPTARRLQFGYNRWLLARRWAPDIERLTRKTDLSPDAAPRITA